MGKSSIITPINQLIKIPKSKGSTVTEIVYPLQLIKGSFLEDPLEYTFFEKDTPGILVGTFMMYIDLQSIYADRYLMSLEKVCKTYNITHISTSLLKRIYEQSYKAHIGIHYLLVFFIMDKRILVAVPGNVLKHWVEIL